MASSTSCWWADVNEPDELLLAFAAALRAAGVAVTQDRAQQFLRAAALAGAERRESVYWAGRATLCGSQDDVDSFDKVFDAWFDPRGGSPVGARPDVRRTARTEPQTTIELDERAGVSGRTEIPVATVASGAEVLRHRDIADLAPAERRRLDQLLQGLDARPPQRSSARLRPAGRGQVDARRTLRDQLRNVGEPGRLRHHRRGIRRRRVVLLVDVSGSMAPYADHLLRLAHRVVQAAPTSTEVFTVGTRLTRVTAALRIRDGNLALTVAGQTVPDWSGGTRLGDVLRAFLDRHGQRGMARGAVVVVLSNGWERGDPTLLAEQARRLRRLAHRLIWVNPHRGKPGYLPVQGGILAVAPALDDLLAGHSLATFEELFEVVARA